MIKVLFFARLKDQLECDQLEVNPQHLETVDQLVSQLSEQGEAWQTSLRAPQILVAVNQNMAQFNSPIKDGDEVAFFPPVTGG